MSLSMALTATFPATLETDPGGSAIAWLSTSLGVLGTWAYLSALAAVTRQDGRPSAQMLIPILGTVMAGLAQITLEHVHLSEPGVSVPWRPPAFAGYLALMSRQLVLRRAYWRLHPLWAALRQAAPHVELPPQPGARSSTCFRLHRRVIEIRDAQLMLAAYCLKDIADQAAAAARSAGLAPEERTAVVEAAVLVTALNARRRGAAAHQHGTAAPYVGTGQSNDLLGEVARLILVSRALRHSRIVRDFQVHPTSRCWEGPGSGQLRWPV